MEHQAKIRPDKCLSEGMLRCMLIDEFHQNGHVHEEKHVIYFPEKVFLVEMSEKKVFFIPVKKIKNGDEEVPIPVFMLDLSFDQKSEIISLAEKNGVQLKMFHFNKPKIFVRYHEDRDPEEEDLIIEGEKEIVTGATED